MYMTVTIHLKEQSHPIVYESVKNAYEKGSFYCVYLSNGTVYKYPIADIFRVIETY